MDRLIGLLRATAVTAVIAGLGFLLAPAQVHVVARGGPVVDTTHLVPAAPGVNADSLAEDIILHNLFAPSRAAPSNRTSASGTPEAAAAEPPDADAGFRPSLIGTAVSERPGETRALLQLDPEDPSPRLYAVGDQAGGYRVVSIEAREVIVAGPRGRIVLRLPQQEEGNT